MKLKIHLLFVILLVGSTLFGQNNKQLKEEIDKVIFFDTEISHDNIPGFIIGVIYQDSTAVFSYGNQSKEETSPLDSSSMFEIGSISKVFTASLASILHEEQIINLDTTLNSYLPEAYRNENLNDLLVRQLVMHTANLPKMPVDFGTFEKEINNPYAHYSKEQLLDFYKNYYPIPRGKNDPEYAYSHVNYAMLEVVIEEATGKKYETVLKEKVFDPLDMNNTCTQLPTKDSTLVLVKGYSRAGMPVDPWSFQSFSASEGVKSNVNDLMNFLQAHLDQYPSDYTSIFDDNSSEKVNTGLSKNAFMGHGWHIIQLKKYHNVILHSGHTAGHRAFIGFVKESKRGVVILAYSEHGTGGLGYLILRLVNYNW